MASNVIKHAITMEERYKAAMVLAGAGDALGYKGGEWEFCHSGRFIHEEVKKLGGLQNIKVNDRDWCVSDDTVMHLATADALIDRSNDDDKPKLYSLIAEYYKGCMKDMSGRAPGATCMTMTHKLKPNVKDGYKIPFNPRGGGCGAAMRAMCIGLRYPSPDKLDDLIAVSIESGRMTHHHPTGYLGSLAAALFTAYSIQDKPPVEWGHGLLEVLEKAKAYVEKGPHGPENLNEWPYFESHWDSYIKLRQLVPGKKPVFPDNYDNPEVRDKYYKDISFGGWGGASGHDSTIIAYDAILGSDGDWEELCKRGVFHGGDSDSTGTIAACCYGAMYGFKGVPKNNYKKLEYKGRLEKAGMELYSLAYPSGGKTEETKQGKKEQQALAATKSNETEMKPNEENRNMEEEMTPAGENEKKEEDMETGDQAESDQAAATSELVDKSQNVSGDHKKTEVDQSFDGSKQEELKKEESSQEDQDKEESKNANPETSITVADSVSGPQGEEHKSPEDQASESEKEDVPSRGDPTSTVDNSQDCKGTEGDKDEKGEEKKVDPVQETAL